MKLSLLRIITLVLILGLVGGIVVWALNTEISMNYWFILFSPLMAAFLFIIWYAFLGWGGWKQRLKVAGILFLLLTIFSGGVRFLTRYEGSTSGTSLPRLVWRWSKDTIEKGDLEINEEVARSGLESVARSAGSNFLGPDRDGMWKTVPFSLDWDVDPPVELWRRPVGQGWSSFAVAEGKAITIELHGDDERVICLNLLDGELLWSHADEGINFVKVMEEKGQPGARMGGEGPRSTPTIFEGKVYVIGSTGIAKCLDFTNGSLLWETNVVESRGGSIPKWGMSSSPLILPGRNLVVFAGAENPGDTLIACDLETGDERWTYRGQGSSYSSPRLLEILGVEQIVSVNGGDVAGIDPDSGEELWRFPWKGSFPKVGQPQLVGENRILATASYGVGSPLIELTRDAGGDWTASQVWRSTRMKTKFSSAVILGDHAYGLDEGRLAAIDLATGEKAWKREKFGYGQQFLVEDHLLVQTEPGEIVLGKPDPEKFTEIARLQALSSMTWNTPTLAGRFLLVRNDREAVCFLLPGKEPSS